MDFDVFVSHASEDKNFSESVCRILESHGISCWIAPRDLLPGIQYADETLQQLLKALPKEALPEPVDNSVTCERQVLREETLLSDCVAESLESFSRAKDSSRKVTPTDLFVDISKYGHGPSVSQLREHGVGPAEIESEIEKLGLDVTSRRA